MKTLLIYYCDTFIVLTDELYLLLLLYRSKAIY